MDRETCIALSGDVEVVGSETWEPPEPTHQERMRVAGRDMIPEPAQILRPVGVREPDPHRRLQEEQICHCTHSQIQNALANQRTAHSSSSSSSQHQRFKKFNEQIQNEKTL